MDGLKMLELGDVKSFTAIFFDPEVMSEEMFRSLQIPPHVRQVRGIPIYGLAEVGDFLQVVDEEMMNKAGWYRKEQQ